MTWTPVSSFTKSSTLMLHLCVSRIQPEREQKMKTITCRGNKARKSAVISNESIGRSDAQDMVTKRSYCGHFSNRYTLTIMRKKEHPVCGKLSRHDGSAIRPKNILFSYRILTAHRILKRSHLLKIDTILTSAVAVHCGKPFATVHR